MLLYFIALCFLVKFSEGKDCYQNVLDCPKVDFDSETVMDHYFNSEDRRWKMLMHSNYLDVFCPYFDELRVCMNNYEADCDAGTKQMMTMFRNTYLPVCVEYRDELEGMLTPCFNNPTYQDQLIACYSTAVKTMRKAGQPINDVCRYVDTWAQCTYSVVQKCSPENVHAIMPIVEAAKPQICLITSY